MERISVPISPPPAKQSVAGDNRVDSDWPETRTPDLPVFVRRSTRVSVRALGYSSNYVGRYWEIHQGSPVTRSLIVDVRVTKSDARGNSNTPFRLLELHCPTSWTTQAHGPKAASSRGQNRQDEKGPERLSPSTQSLASESFGGGARPNLEDRLHMGVERSSILADSAPAMIWSSGPEKLCDYFNRSWLDYRGRTLEQEIGQGWLEGVHPDDLERCTKARSSKLDQRQSLQIEYRLRRHDNVYHWIFDTGSPWFWPPGAFRGYVGSCIDTHQRKLAEENLRETNAALCNQKQGAE
jgi:PAS domain S-box-containing protein